MTVTSLVENSALLVSDQLARNGDQLFFNKIHTEKWLKNRTQQDLLRLSFTCKYCQVHKLQRMHLLCFHMLGVRMGGRGRIHLTFFRSTI